ncbi:Protein CBG18649 [Caenorhabditis briggsae]|uniref:Protein CBG18649 n=1 Tax=Caenorhabditis briggsae TaxID=6238 RepID=A8XTT4_CAEBR|nr:Protein CBG18649 [Caenorhabditis briggsae]CAP36060.1 Protein CBG18649 [Caenorhabditis briggsae]
MYSSQNQSKAWRFFEKQRNGQTVTCKLCGRSIKFHSSTTTMHQHLNSHHEKEVEKMERSSYVFFDCAFPIPQKQTFSRVRKLNPDHQILTPDSLRKKLADKEKEYVEISKKSMKNAEKVWISVDGWSAKYMDSTLYAVFVFYVENFERKSKLLGIEPISALQRQLMSAGLLLIYFTNLA